MDSPQLPVEELLARVRRGDDAAVRQLVASYEPFIRRAIRPQIAKYNLRAAVDSADICQSVLGSFLLRLASGRYSQIAQDDLERLLIGIARRKFAGIVRREYAQRRDRNRHQSLESHVDAVEQVRRQPDQIAQRRDLLDRIRQQLAPDELQLFTLRGEGRSWAEISELTGLPETQLRQRFSRATRRVLRDLG